MTTPGVPRMNSPSICTDGSTNCTVIMSKTKSKIQKKKNPAVRANASAPVSLPTTPIRVRMVMRPPSMGADQRVEGIDYLGTVSSTTSLVAAVVYGIIPTNNTSFPRLSNQAKLFQQYRFKRLAYHFFGRSASTQKGNIGVGAVVNYGFGGTVTVSTEAQVKNLEDALVLKGWEDGKYVVRCRDETWLACDNDALSSNIGSSLGNLYYTIPATTAAGDLAWDSYVEYDIEFRGMAASGSVN